MKNWRKWTFTLTSLLALAGLTSCNIYGGIDKPSGDAQLISAARACLDDGNFSCATTYYQQVSASNLDIQQSEEAFTLLNQSGASMAAFAGAFGNGQNISVGSAITTLADYLLVTGTVGQVMRTSIYTAFESETRITDSGLKNMVKFLGAVSFAAEILAEIAESQNSSVLLKSNVNANSLLGYSGGTVGGHATLEAVVNASAGATITAGTWGSLDMFNIALSDASNAISALAGNGSLASLFSGTSSIGTLINAACSAPCNSRAAYNAALAAAGVGN